MCTFQTCTHIIVYIISCVFFLFFLHCLFVRGVTVRISNSSQASSKWKWSSLSPWSGDFGVSRACVCAHWNALGKGSDLISSLSLAGMFPWQRCTVCVSRFANGHRAALSREHANWREWKNYAPFTKCISNDFIMALTCPVHSKVPTPRFLWLSGRALH